MQSRALCRAQTDGNARRAQLAFNMKLLRHLTRQGQFDRVRFPSGFHRSSRDVPLIHAVTRMVAQRLLVTEGDYVIAERAVIPTRVASRVGFPGCCERSQKPSKIGCGRRLRRIFELLHAWEHTSSAASQGSNPPRDVPHLPEAVRAARRSQNGLASVPTDSRLSAANPLRQPRAVSAEAPVQEAGAFR